MIDLQKARGLAYSLAESASIKADTNRRAGRNIHSPHSINIRKSAANTIRDLCDELEAMTFSVSGLPPLQSRKYPPRLLTCYVIEGLAARIPGQSSADKKAKERRVI